MSCRIVLSIHYPTTKIPTVRTAVQQAHPKKPCAVLEAWRSVTASKVYPTADQTMSELSRTHRNVLGTARGAAAVQGNRAAPTKLVASVLSRWDRPLQ